MCSGDLEGVIQHFDGSVSSFDPTHDFPGRQTFTVPLLHDVQLDIDDEDAAVVLIFPRKSHLTRRLVQEPHVARANIFREDPGDVEDPMSGKEFERQVREKVVEKLVGAGFQLKTRDSIDREEIFMLVKLPRDGTTIRQLAGRYSYRMPLKAEAYHHLREHIMKNDWGHDVPGYVTYEDHLEPWVQDFSHRDEVLISKRLLDELLDFNELRDQGVITKHFAAANFKKIMSLNRTWANLRRLCYPPDVACKHLSPATENLDAVRDYYGEEVAFFYMWLARFIRWLMPLAVMCLLAEFARNRIFTSPKQDKEIRVMFACAVVLWASLVNKFWSRASARMKQQWGISAEANVQTWSTVWSYRPELNKTWRHSARSSFSYVCPILYCCVFMRIIGWLQPHFDGQVPQRLASSLPSLAVFLFLNLWSRIVPRVVNLQNHEMQARWNDALTWFLAPVKLFLALWPFLYITFFKKYRETIIPDDSSYQNVLAQVANAFNASECRGSFSNTSLFNDTELIQLLRQQEFADEDGILYGCLPVDCWLGKDFPLGCVGGSCLDVGKVRMRTNCLNELETQLLTFYALHFCSMLGLIIAPIVIARCTMKNVIIKENLRASGEHSEEEMSEVRYSLLQFQAKCFELAEYAYWSWGGSWVENFMEPAIVFLHMQCFCIIRPGLAFAAFLASMLEYRLMAYRHNNVTCRNWPYASHGIGAWRNILLISSFTAVFCIVCKVTLLDDEEKLFDTTSLESKIGLEISENGDTKLGNFIFLQLVMLGIQALVLLLIPDDPDDVERIGNFNAHIRTKLKLQQVQRLEDSTSVERALSINTTTMHLLQSFAESSSASCDSAEESLSASESSFTEHGEDAWLRKPDGR